MGWGPVDWVERVLPEAKLKNTTTLLFEIFRFERPIPRYLLKTVLPCKALGFSYGLITAVIALSSFSSFGVCQKDNIRCVRQRGREKFNEISHSGKEGEVLL